MSATSGHTAVMAAKRPKLNEPTPWQALELFPTPPWATRALTRYVIPGQDGFARQTYVSVWETCAGLGHMSDVLREDFEHVRASDVMLYPLASGGDTGQLEIDRLDFLDTGAAAAVPDVEWIVTNPPFSRAAAMLDLALANAQSGVAFLLRIQWLEGAGRYDTVFAERAPTVIAPFVERVPMCEGGWDPNLSSATMYAWFVWMRAPATGEWDFRRPDDLTVDLIPPGAAQRYSLPSDRDFASRHVPGWIAPSRLKRTGRGQTEMSL